MVGSLAPSPFSVVQQGSNLMPVDLTPFLGHGSMHAPQPACIRDWPGHPLAVSNGQARRTIEAFVAAGHSYHSNMGATVWVVMTWCMTHRRSFQVTSHYDGERVIGYSVKLEE